MHVTKTPLAPFVLMVMAGAAYSSLSSAQIVTDGSVGAQVTLNGIDVDIVETLGTRAGDNLFHSFETFNIQTDGTVTFTGASDINNVITRVTGGEVSNIDGVLRSEVGSANFFFINPAGVAFGEGGSVDVPASFHLSTADELRFVDGTAFSANTSDTSTLSMAAPEAFGFLGNGAGSISVDGGFIVIGNTVDSDSQSSITLSASDIVLNGSEVHAPGAIGVAAVGDVVVNYDLESGAENSINGVLEVRETIGIDLATAAIADSVLVEAGEIEVSGELHGFISGAGGTRIIANDLVVSEVGAITSEGTVDVQASGQVSIVSGGTVGSSLVFGASDTVTVTTGQLLIDGEGVDERTGIINDIGILFGSNSGGNIEVSVTDVVTIQNGGVISTADSLLGGDAGDVAVSAGQLVIDGQNSEETTGIFSVTGGLAGSAGSIDVAVAETADILSGGQITTITSSTGDAGNITLAAEQLLIDSQDSDELSGITSLAPIGATGNAGSIELTISEMAEIQNGGRIFTATQGDGNAGDITLSARELFIDRQDNAITGLTSNAFFGSTGRSGSIEVTVTELLTVQNGGRISTETDSTDVAGNIVIQAGQLFMDGQDAVGVTSIFNDTGGAGSGGNIEVSIEEEITIQNGGTISTEVFGDGDAGNVVVTAGQLSIDGQGGTEMLTGIFSATFPGTIGNLSLIHI